MNRIVNLVGDGHTYLRSPLDRANLPVDLERFGNEYRVVGVADQNTAVLGARVLSIDGVPVDQARERLRSITPADETETLRDLRVTSFLTSGIALHGTGIIADRNVAHFGLVDDSGRASEVAFHAVPEGQSETLKWRDAFEKRPLSRDNPDDDFWCVELAKDRTIYCPFRGYEHLSSKSRILFDLIKRASPDKVVIDLRANGGGDYEVGLEYLVEPLRDLPAINRTGHLFVLIGPSTFSAAMSNAAHFRLRTHALLVGEQIGEKPNSYQEVRELELPNSGWTLRYSVKFYTFVEHGENVIKPDQEIIPTWEQYRSGQDPVLDWVLAHGDEAPK